MNTEFAFWLDFSGLGKKELARRVRARCHAKQLRHVSTESSRIRAWLGGQQPDPDVAEAVAEVMTEACGEPLTLARLGLSAGNRQPSGQVINLPWQLPPVIEAVDKHSRSDLLVTRPDLDSEYNGVATGHAFTDPLQRWLAAESSYLDPNRVAPRGVDATHITQIEAATQVFRDWDNERGGGLRRKAVVGQLNEVTELLHGPFASETIKKRLFISIADLAQLAGWMSYDAGLHSTAQKYFVLGLHLAKEAGDPLQGARMLYCLARQTIDLGHAQDALELTQLALYGSRRTPAPRVSAMLKIMNARALVNLPDPQVRESEHALESAYDAFDRARPGDDPEWTAFFDEAELAGMSGACYRELAGRDQSQTTTYAPKAEYLIHNAIKLRDSAYLRSHVFDLNGLAETQLLLDQPEQAATTVDRALALSDKVGSRRMACRLHATTRKALQSFPHLPEVKELSEKVSGAALHHY